MARKTESRRIGDFTYYVIQLPAGQATEAAFRFGNVIGPAVKVLKSGGVAAAGQLLTDLKHEDLVYFTGLFRELTTFDAKGKRLALDAVYDDHFAGDLGSLFKWLTFCFELNFKSFFPDLAALLAKAEEKAAVTAEDTSPST